MMASDPSRSKIELSQRIADIAPRVRGFLRRLERGSQECEDLLQDVLERALRYQDSFDPVHGEIEPWLMRIAFRTYLDHRAGRSRRPESIGSADRAAADSHPAELRDQVGYLLSYLTPVEQDIILRFHQNQETIAEIGRDLNMPQGTIKSHLHRARRKLSGTGSNGEDHR